MPSEAIALAAVAGTSGTGAAIDLWTRRVPNPLTIATAALGLTLAAADVSGMTIRQAAAGGCVGLALMLPGHVIGRTGAGDVKLFAALGTLLGPSRIGLAFLYTGIAGGLLALLVAASRRSLPAVLKRIAILFRTRGANVAAIEDACDNRFAFAPAIACGAIASALGF
jgi:prepilin peptidase CpaA